MYNALLQPYDSRSRLCVFLIFLKDYLEGFCTNFLDKRIRVVFKMTFKPFIMSMVVSKTGETVSRIYFVCGIKHT